TTLIASSTQTHSSTAPTILSGVVRNAPRSSPVTRESRSVARASATYEKKDGSDSRPTGQLAPAPAERAWAALDLAALEYRARRGEIIWLYEDETIVWRFTLPRAGWWRKAQRSRWPTRPLSQSHIKSEESRKRQAWVRYRSWSRMASGVLLSVIGAVQYGTSKVFSKVVPHLETEGLRQYI